MTVYSRFHGVYRAATQSVDARRAFYSQPADGTSTESHKHRFPDRKAHSAVFEGPTLAVTPGDYRKRPPPGAAAGRSSGEVERGSRQIPKAVSSGAVARMPYGLSVMARSPVQLEAWGMASPETPAADSRASPRSGRTGRPRRC